MMRGMDEQKTDQFVKVGPQQGPVGDLEMWGIEGGADSISEGEL